METAAEIQNETPSLSIVVPVYNEEANVRPLFEKIHAVCEEIYVTYEVLFVDDGSQDDTFAVLSALHEELCARCQNESTGESRPVGAISKRGALRVIRFEKNAGQTAAMAAGFEYARGEYIVSMDGDLQNDPGDIPRLLRQLDRGYDLVCGWRKDRQDKLWTRRVPSVVANWLIRKVTGISIHDTGCSLKAYRAAMIKQVPLYGEMHRFIPVMSRVVLALSTEVVVTHHPRRFGTSKYGLGRIWRVLLDLIAFSFILTGFTPRLREKPKRDGKQRNNPKETALSYSRGFGIPFLAFGGILLVTQDALFTRSAFISLGLGLAALGMGWMTARAIVHAQQSADLGKLAWFFMFVCRRRPIRIFGPIGALMLASSGILLLLYWDMILYTLLLMHLVQILMHGGALVFWFGILGELVAFANADKVKDYKVKTLL